MLGMRGLSGLTLKIKQKMNNIKYNDPLASNNDLVESKNDRLESLFIYGGPNCVFF